MNHATLDCSGMSCPQPLMACKALIESQRPDSLTVTVDNEAALENVSRFLTASGYTATSEPAPKGWTINAASDGAPRGIPDVAEFPCPVPSPEDQRIVVFLTSATIGRGDDGLGDKLMGNFLKTLPEVGPELWRIVMVNGAVKLACQGNPHLEDLKALEASGVSILVCGTCLDFFGLLEKRAVGQTTNMLDVVTSLQLADKVIRP